jgi:hypothetical protein
MELPKLGASACVRWLNAVTTLPRRFIERLTEEYLKAATFYL